MNLNIANSSQLKHPPMHHPLKTHYDGLVDEQVEPW
jgi:hypothetical protein